MIIERMKKVLSGVMVAMFVIAYTAPIGICITTTVPKITAGVEKPVLRKSNAPTSLKLEGDISISKSNPKVSLSLRDSDVKQVLRMFADKAGLNIIFHSSVDNADFNTGSGTNSSSGPSNSKGRTVTLDLVNVPLNDAFAMVLQVADLTYYLDNNTIIITSAAAAKNLNLSKQDLMIVPVKYVDASALAKFLNKNIFTINKPGLSNSEIAVTNPTTNEILIFGTKNDYLMAKKIIEQMDKKPLEQTFTVNHTTPKEMAQLICNTLLRGPSIGYAPVVTGPTGTTGAQSSTTPTTGAGATPTTTTTSTTSTSALTLGGGVIACQYTDVVNTANLSSIGTKSLSVTYFPQRGVINVIGGSEQQIEMIRDFIKMNDKKQPQAYLEISLIELSESGSRDFNNTWRVWSDNFAIKFNGTTATNSLYPTFFRGDTYKEVDSTGKITNTYSKFTGTPTIAYTMDYLIKNGKGRILANPKIMITNGETSKIDLSSDYVKMITSQIVTNATSGTPTVQKTYTIGSDEGIVVEIVPFISPDGYVSLNIKPNYSTEKGDITDYNSATEQTDKVGTLLQRRNLDLKNIRIKDGETMVIGGMIRESEIKNVAKMPLLGDLPGIGLFFRNTNTSKEKQELVIMLTPKIIKDSEDMVKEQGTTL